MNRRYYLSTLHSPRRGLLSAPAFGPRTKDPAKLRVALLPDENAATLIQNAQPLKTVPGANTQKGHRTDRYHRLLLDDRGHAFWPH